jgi:PKD repeat protein
MAKAKILVLTVFIFLFLFSMPVQSVTVSEDERKSEFAFSLYGGNQSVSGKSVLFADGGFDYAQLFGKRDNDKLFFQVSGKIRLNSVSNQYFFNLGLGYMSKDRKVNAGAFLDGRYEPELIDNHVFLNARPFLRLNYNDFSLLAYASFPINGKRVLISETQDKPVYFHTGEGYYSQTTYHRKLVESLTYGGIDLTVRPSRNLEFRLSGLVAEYKTFGGGAGIDLWLSNKWMLSADGFFMKSNDAVLLPINTLEGNFNGFRAGINYMIGGSRDRDRRKLVVKPKYPILIVLNKTEVDVKKISEPLEIEISADKEIACTGEEVQFGAVVKGGTAPFKFDWDFIDGKPNSSQQNPVHIFDYPGQHCVRLVVKDSNGLEARKTVCVRVEDCGGKEEVELVVTKCVGVTGNPVEGTTVHNMGDIVTYDYALKDGFTNLTVTFNGMSVPESGEVTLDQKVNELVVCAEYIEATNYTLTVEFCAGVTGNPDPGQYVHKEGDTVTYNYSLLNGYKNLKVTDLDTNDVLNDNGTIKMNRDYNIKVCATPISNSYKLLVIFTA